MTEQVDMSQFIAARSDQMNADDLLDGPRTITITKVTASPDSAEQPVSIHYEGDNGKPFKPCKTVRRIMVGVWDKYTDKYVGRSMTLFRDPTVAFGGMQVGGIRVSHMSHITEKKTIALQVTRGRKAPYTVLPLVTRPAPSATDDPATKWANGYIAKLDTFATLDALKAFENEKSAKLAELEKARPDLHKLVTDAVAGRTAQLSPSGFDDDFESGPDDGEQPDETPPNPATNDTLAATLAKIANAASTREVDAIDKDTETDRAFLSPEDTDRLDEALAKRREELRAKEVAE